MLKKIKLYYDKECPFCNEYSKYVELRKIYDIEIINAREALDKLKDYKYKGFDINNGMIIEFEDNIFQGSDAIEIIDKYIVKKGIIDRFLSVFIHLPGFKSIVYPIVKIIRLIVLKLLGRNTKINF